MRRSHTATVAAVVVTYNRRALLSECLNALLQQTHALDMIYVIDNASRDGTREMVLERYADKTLRYEHLPNNLGGAGGFHAGMSLAHASGYEWIWVMDDDSMPQPDCLARLLGSTDKSVGFVAPLIRTPEGRPQAYHHKRFTRSLFPKEVPSTSWLHISSELGPTEVDANAFVGPLINREAVESVGLPNPQFFITWDDTEYTYRISRRLKCYLIPDATIVHKDRSSAAAAAYGGTLDWKTYYSTRNGILFVRSNNGILGSWLYALYVAGRALCGLVWPRTARPGLRSRMDLFTLRLWAAWDGACNARGRRVMPPAPIPDTLSFEQDGTFLSTQSM